MLIELPEYTIYAENGFSQKFVSTPLLIGYMLDEFEKNCSGKSFLIEVKFKNKTETFLGSKEFLKEKVNTIFDS